MARAPAVAPHPQARAARPGARVSVLVPVLDEQATIVRVLERLRAALPDAEVIVVDDGSTDRTPVLLRRWCERHPDCVVVTKPNGGKGSALRAGLGRVTGDVVAILDADLEYDPADLPALAAPVAAGEADVVFGSRFARGDGWQPANRLGNRGLSLLTSLLFCRRLSDMETGYKVFSRDALAALHLREDGFGVEPEITAQVLRRRLRLRELPISYHARCHAEGKKIRWRDGIRAVLVLLVNRVRG